jgi:hypothetical protein
VDSSGKRVTYFIMPDGSAAAFVEDAGTELKMTLRIESAGAQRLAQEFKDEYPQAEIRGADLKGKDVS